MAREKTTRTLLDRATAWSPVLLLGGLAALTYWLDSQVQPPPPRYDGSERHDPDIFIEGFRAVELDPQGRPRQAVAGTRAIHFGDDQTTEITDPLLSQTEEGKPEFRITAKSGRLSGDRKEVSFTGNVRAVREAGPTVPGESPAGPVTMTTEFLHVVPDKEFAQTDKAVTIEEPRGIIHSVGLTLDNKAKTLKLRSGVNGTLQPQALPAQALPKSK
ncbi:MAG TPA: LPS export ABC transporter periplasmic protein LptC [Casimicrobiaceae bacterium]|nr:LPS export ABC transporter periplasmic protein LptC [Casimicrobiaceae bacterium]